MHDGGHAVRGGGLAQILARQFRRPQPAARHRCVILRLPSIPPSLPPPSRRVLLYPSPFHPQLRFPLSLFDRCPSVALSFLHPSLPFPSLPSGYPWMATLLLLGLWMFLSLTLVKEQDLGRKFQSPAAGGRAGGRGGGQQHQQMKNGEGEGAPLNGGGGEIAGGNGEIRRASLTRKEVSHEGGREGGWCNQSLLIGCHIQAFHSLSPSLLVPCAPFSRPSLLLR